MLVSVVSVENDTSDHCICEYHRLAGVFAPDIFGSYAISLACALALFPFQLLENVWDFDRSAGEVCAVEHLHRAEKFAARYIERADFTGCSDEGCERNLQTLERST